MIVKLISWFGMWRGAVVDDENGKILRYMRNSNLEPINK